MGTSFDLENQSGKMRLVLHDMVANKMVLMADGNSKEIETIPSADEQKRPHGPGSHKMTPVPPSPLLLCVDNDRILCFFFCWGLRMVYALSGISSVLFGGLFCFGGISFLFLLRGLCFNGGNLGSV